jgi:hypothetical protein
VTILYALGSPNSGVFRKEVYMLRKVSRCDDRKRSTKTEGRLDEEEAEGSSADGSQHGDNTGLATEGRGSVVIVVGGSGSAGRSSADGTLNASAGGVELGADVVAGAVVVGLDPALGVTAVLGSPLLDLVAVALGPFFNVGDLATSLALGPVLDIVGEVARQDSAGGDLGSSLLSGDEAGSGDNSDLGEKHCDCFVLRW